MDINTLSKEYRDIYGEFIMPVDTNIKLESVILSDENKENISVYKGNTI